MSKNFLKESVKPKTDWFMNAFEIYFLWVHSLSPCLARVYVRLCKFFIFLYIRLPLFPHGRALVVSKYGINYFGSTRLKRKTHTYLLYSV